MVGMVTGWHVIVTASGEKLRWESGDTALFATEAQARRWMLPGDRGVLRDPDEQAPAWQYHDGEWVRG